MWLVATWHNRYRTFPSSQKVLLYSGYSKEDILQINDPQVIINWTLSKPFTCLQSLPQRSLSLKYFHYRSCHSKVILPRLWQFILEILKRPHNNVSTFIPNFPSTSSTKTRRQYTHHCIQCFISFKEKKETFRLVKDEGMPGSLFEARRKLAWESEKFLPKYLFLINRHPEIHWPDFYILRRGPVFCFLK